MPSFDVVSKLDHHEIDNALDQARRELGQRFDFKGTNTEVDKGDEGIVIRSSSEGRVQAALDVIRDKMARRSVSLKALDAQAPKPAGNNTWRMVVALREGVSQDHAKQIVKMLKAEKAMKLQASIQGDSVRVSHKKRDVLQQAIQLLKGADLELPLQFENFRD
jgi:uncharacterized protein YajQ (UPF0234 family)